MDGGGSGGGGLWGGEGNGLGKMKAETGAMELQVKECQGLAEPPETGRQAQNGFLPEPQREPSPAESFISDI